jgi:hypothetical protein
MSICFARCFLVCVICLVGNYWNHWALASPAADEPGESSQQAAAQQAAADQPLEGGLDTPTATGQTQIHGLGQTAPLHYGQGQIPDAGLGHEQTPLAGRQASSSQSQRTLLSGHGIIVPHLTPLTAGQHSLSAHGQSSLSALGQPSLFDPGQHSLSVHGQSSLSVPAGQLSLSPLGQLSLSAPGQSSGSGQEPTPSEQQQRPHSAARWTMPTSMTPAMIDVLQALLQPPPAPPASEDVKLPSRWSKGWAICGKSKICLKSRKIGVSNKNFFSKNFCLQ